MSSPSQVSTHLSEFQVKLKVKVRSYIAQYPVLALYTSSPGRTVHSCAILNSLGSIQPCCNYCTKTLLRYPPLFVTRYSFIRLSELWQRGINETAKPSKRQQENLNTGKNLFFSFGEIIRQIIKLFLNRSNKNSVKKGKSGAALYTMT